MNQLTPEQLQALAAGDARFCDPHTNAAYVLVRQETYEQFQALLELGPLTREEREVLLRGVWQRAAWDDPRMDAYDALSPESP